MFCGKLYKLFALLAFLLIFAPTMVGAVGLKVSGTTSAIDTLTVTVQGGNAAEVSTISRIDTIKINGGQNGILIVDSLEIDSVKFAPFRVQRLNSTTIRFLPPPGGNVSGLKINGVDLNTAIIRKGITYSLIRESAPALSNYGLVILTLLLAGTAIWLFRKRMAKAI